MHPHQTLPPDPTSLNGWSGVFARLGSAGKRRRSASPCWRRRIWRNIHWRGYNVHRLSESGSKNIQPECIEKLGQSGWSPSRGLSIIPFHSWPGAAIEWGISGRIGWEWWQWWRWRRCTTPIGERKWSADTKSASRICLEVDWYTYDANVLRLSNTNIGRMSPEPRSDAHDCEYIWEIWEKLIMYISSVTEAARRVVMPNPPRQWRRHNHPTISWHWIAGAQASAMPRRWWRWWCKRPLPRSDFSVGCWMEDRCRCPPLLHSIAYRDNQAGQVTIATQDLLRGDSNSCAEFECCWPGGYARPGGGEGNGWASTLKSRPCPRMKFRRASDGLGFNFSQFLASLVVMLARSRG